MTASRHILANRAPNSEAWIGSGSSDHAQDEAILGRRRRAGWRPWDTTAEVIRLLQGVDVHVLRRNQ